MDYLLVDGYNMIGAWPVFHALREKDFSHARTKLVDMLADYQAYSGYKVIVVFDAHMVKGTETKEKTYRVDVIYTKENETADEKIERLAGELKNIKNKVYVATSDFTEQWTIFSQGALRISARELYQEIIHIQKKISTTIKEVENKKMGAKIPLSSEVAEIFEKWRRGGR